MINVLSIIKHTSRYSSAPYTTFAIDGVPLEVWLPSQNPAAEHDLIAAHAGLDNDEETLMVWDRIYSIAPEWKTLVPLLVCPDDLDLCCSVIVVEQLSNQRHIQWCRFGLLNGSIREESPAVDWFDAIPSLMFERSNFQATLDEFRRTESIKMSWD
ncbi:hypothetical protein [Pseudomonas tohonis]|uniref:hypothetical protein n=1 Tax=Pseudomonas tohonis TaxID=2725477 RepID=UPI001F331CC0|nr:hypothetical protein [Pseudomonas tohonis]